MPALTAVLVLYRQRLCESRCYQSLVRVLQSNEDSGLTLLVYDNSPTADSAAAEATTPPALRLLYQHDPANGGVAAAYNAGLAEARANSSPWLLLLDQDTELTPAFFAELYQAIAAVPNAVSAIVPRLQQDGIPHSPQQLPRLSHRPLPAGTTGLLPMEVTAFNSGAALRVAALTRFPARYWLDFLDHAIFHELQAAGGRVWLLQARLQHSLSTEQLGTEASLARYQNVLAAERDFYRDYGSPADRTWYHLRRAKQALGQLLKVRDKSFALWSLRAALGLLPQGPTRNADSLAH